MTSPFVTVHQQAVSVQGDTIEDSRKLISIELNYDVSGRGSGCQQTKLLANKGCYRPSQPNVYVLYNKL